MLTVFTGKLLDKQFIKETKAGKSYIVTMEVEEVFKQPQTKINSGQIIEMGFNNPSEALDKDARFLVYAHQYWKRIGDPKERKIVAAYGISTGNTVPLDEVEKLRGLSIITSY